jgi:hypothetical protein
MLTAIAGMITAITGLIAVLNQTGVINIGRWGSSPPNPTERVLLRRSLFRGSIAPGAKRHFYDVDGPAQLDTRTGAVDFFFKPDNANDPHTRVGVDPLNGARYAPRSAGRLPWEVPPAEFTASGGVYSIAQGEEIPCYTSDGRPCMFQIRLEPPDRMSVSFALYR